LLHVSSLQTTVIETVVGVFNLNTLDKIKNIKGMQTIRKSTFILKGIKTYAYWFLNDFSIQGTGDV